MRALGELTDLVLPRRCGGCAAPGVAFCARCRAGLGAVRGRVGGLDVVAAGAYAGPLRSAVLRYKERGRRDLAGPLAAVLVDVVLDLLALIGAGTTPILLVPVPSARAAAAARGGDHVLRLATRAAAGAGVGVARGALTLRRRVADSAGLGIDERAQNLAGAFAARRAPPGWAALVLDDVVTTGATLAEARRALAAAGWPVLGAAVLAATARRRGERSDRVEPSAPSAAPGAVGEAPATGGFEPIRVPASPRAPLAAHRGAV